MPIIVCGLNHKTAPVALREQVVFPLDKIPLYLKELSEQWSVREAVLLSTCNRSEIYCVADDASQVTQWFCEQHAALAPDLQPVLYAYSDQAAIEHIMNVVCGLDSMMLGESDIVRQMKDAFAESCAAGAVDTLFNRLFQEIFSVAKEVRTSTAIGACPVSVASAAVQFIKEKHSRALSDSTVLLVGAGATIDLALRYLKNHPPKKAYIANRSIDAATLLAEKYQCEVIALSDGLMQADVIISATGSTHPLITQQMLTQCHQSLSIVDIAVPRDVEPSCAELDHVQLYCIDDLKDIIQHNRQGREHAGQKASQMIQQKSAAFMMWLSSFDKVAMTIRAYRHQTEHLCQVELEKAIRQLEKGELPAEVLSHFSRALINKVLHAPTVQLRQAGFEGRLDMLELAAELFAISERTTESIN